MPIEYQKKVAVFKQNVDVEAAEQLLQWLQNNPRGRIDLAACTHLHAANLQVLMAAMPAIGSWPADANLHSWLETSLSSK